LTVSVFLSAHAFGLTRISHKATTDHGLFALIVAWSGFSCYKWLYFVHSLRQDEAAVSPQPSFNAKPEAMASTGVDRPHDAPAVASDLPLND
jgi:hypothetical protein